MAPALTTTISDPEAARTDEAEFDLDLRVIEAEYPIPILMCDTSDGCGGSCASACNTNANDPF